VRGRVRVSYPRFAECSLPGAGWLQGGAGRVRLFDVSGVPGGLVLVGAQVAQTVYLPKITSGLVKRRARTRLGDRRGDFGGGCVAGRVGQCR